MGRPRKPQSAKVLDRLWDDLTRNRLELLRIANYPGEAWDRIREEYERVILSLDSAIRNVTANGIPETYTEDPHWKRQAS